MNMVESHNDFFSNGEMESKEFPEASNLITSGTISDAEDKENVICTNTEKISVVDTSLDGNSPTKNLSKRKKNMDMRKDLNEDTISILKTWLLAPENIDHPYPSEEEKQELMKKTGIERKRLSNWFTNARKRIWKPNLRERYVNQLQQIQPDAYVNGFVNDPTFHTITMEKPERIQVKPKAKVIRSVSEAEISDLDDYINAARVAEQVVTDREKKRSISGIPSNDDIELHEEGCNKKRNGLPAKSSKILLAWMMSPEHINHPYPTDVEKKQLIRETGIDMYQLNNWFTNNRKRIWKPAMFGESHTEKVTKKSRGQRSKTIGNLYETQVQTETLPSSWIHSSLNNPPLFTLPRLQTSLILKRDGHLPEVKSRARRSATVDIGLLDRESHMSIHDLLDSSSSNYLHPSNSTILTSSTLDETYHSQDHRVYMVPSFFPRTNDHETKLPVLPRFNSLNINCYGCIS